MSSEEIISFLTNRRIELEISQKELADELGYSAQLVSNWERNKSLPDLASLSGFCPILKVTIDEIFSCKVTNKYNDEYKVRFDITKFSKNLKMIRLYNNLNQIDFAEKIGVSSATIIAWEKGNSTPNINQFLKIKETFSISYEELYFGYFKNAPSSPSPKKKHKNKGLIATISALLACTLVATSGLIAWSIIKDAKHGDSSSSSNPSSSIISSSSDEFSSLSALSSSSSSSSESSSSSSFQTSSESSSSSSKESSSLESSSSESSSSSSESSSQPSSSSSESSSSSKESSSSQSSSSESSSSSSESSSLQSSSSESSSGSSSSYVIDESKFTVVDHFFGDYFLAGYTGNEKTLYIPSIIDSKPIKLIDEAAFLNNTSIENVIIGDGITELRPSVFKGCTNLKSIEIPNSVKVIGPSCFTDCSSLESIVIPTSVTEIPPFCFCQCYSLKNITLHNEITLISQHAFDSCTSLTNITLPNKITTIYQNTFRKTKISELNLPSSITRIEFAAFTEMEKLSFLKLPNSVTYIGDNFISVNTEVIVPNSVKIWIYSKCYDDWRGRFKIYYEGSKQDCMNNITFPDVVPDFDNGNLYYYSETPIEHGWHYVDNRPVLY